MIRKLLPLSFMIGGFVAQALPAPAWACQMPEGFHEYGSFGKKAVYLYHFPMFGSIHAYQVLVQADLDVGGKNADDLFFAAEKSHPGALFITSPTKASDGSPDYWILPDYSVPGASFHARVHFEEGGKDETLFDSATVTVRKVLFNHLLLSKAPRPGELSYLYFGNPDEGYLLHLATWDPDFDQIVEVSPTAGETRRLQFDSRPNDEPDRLKAGESLTAKDGETPFPIHVLRELFEFKIDLQH